MAEPARRMLTRVEIENFRCIRKVGVDLGPFTVLIGPNDSGKTAFLKAIESIARIAAGRPLAQVFPPLADSLAAAAALRSPSPASEMAFAVNMDDGAQAIRYELRVGAGSQEEGPWVMHEVLGRGQGPLRPDAPDVLAGIKVSGMGDGRDLAMFVDGRQIGTVPGAESGCLARWGRKYRPDLVGALGALGDPLQGGEGRLIHRLSATAVTRDAGLGTPSQRLDSEGGNLPGVIAQMKLGYAATFNTLLKHLHEVTGGSVIDVLASSERGDGVVSLKLVFANGAEIRAEYASTGLLYMLAVLALLYGPSRAWLLLLEEPENSVHVSRLREIVKLLRAMTEPREGRPAAQVIITTHSPYLLDCCKPEEVRVFRRPPGDWTQVDVPPADANERWWGMSLGELWGFSGEDALIEGPRAPRGTMREIET